MNITTTNPSGMRIWTLALGSLMLLAGTVSTAAAAPDRSRPIHVSAQRAPVKHVRVYRPSRRRSPPPVRRVRYRAPRRTVVVHTPPPRKTVVVKQRSPKVVPKKTDGEWMVLMGGELGTSSHDMTRAPNFVTGLRLAAVLPGGGGISQAWAGGYGRLNFEPEADITRAAVGLTAGFMLFNAELGVVSETYDPGPGFMDRDRAGTELLLGLGLFEYVGVYSRITRFSDGGNVNEAGLRMNIPLG